MNPLIRLLFLCVISPGAFANQPADFDGIATVFVHDTENAQASVIGKADIAWMIAEFQSCSWDAYQSRLALQRYVFSFFDRSDELMMSGQLVDSDIFMSAGEGVFVCAVSVDTAERIQRLQQKDKYYDDQ